MPAAFGRVWVVYCFSCRHLSIVFPCGQLFQIAFTWFQEMFDFCPYQKAKTWFKQYYSRQAPKLLVFPPVFQSVACFRLRLRTLDWFLSVGTSETGSQLTLPWWQKGDWNEMWKVERAYGFEFAMMVGEWWVSHLMLFMQVVDICGLWCYTLCMILEWYKFVPGSWSKNIYLKIKSGQT